MYYINIISFVAATWPLRWVLPFRTMQIICCGSWQPYWTFPSAVNTNLQCCVNGGSLRYSNSIPHYDSSLIIELSRPKDYISMHVTDWFNYHREERYLWFLEIFDDGQLQSNQNRLSILSINQIIWDIQGKEEIILFQNETRRNNGSRDGRDY